LIVNSYVNGLAQSWAHKLGRPLQLLRGLLRPRFYGLGDLYANEDLEPPHTQRKTWVVSGPQPRFAIPRWFPDGGLRLQLALTSETDGVLALETQHGADLHEVDRLAAIPIEKGRNEKELYVRLRRPALAALLRPCDGLDRFRFDDLRLRPMPGPVAKFLAWVRGLPLAGAWFPDQAPAKRRSATPPAEAILLPSDDHEYPVFPFRGEATLDCSVIIPTINEVDLVCQCVASCRQQLPRNASLEFIVVDDGTRDPAVRQALARAAVDLGFTVFFSPQNLGFSAAVNLGMSRSKGRYLVLCNNDIRFVQAWLEPLHKAFAQDPRVGVVGARLFYPDGRIQHAGMDKLPNQLRWVHRFKEKPGNHGPANQSCEVWSVTGALLALRRETVVRLGGLSTAYALAYEDLDYCLHAWSRGVRVRYCPEVAAQHLESVTRGDSLQGQWGKPRLWAERQRLGQAYFEKKWWRLRNVTDLDEFLQWCDLQRSRAPG
jgi:GT2 family glycosyltransferase